MIHELDVKHKHTGAAELGDVANRIATEIPPKYTCMQSVAGPR